MSFFLHTGNKLEDLAERFCQTIGSCRRSDPLERETVIVQTQGIAAYLRQYIASYCGAAVNIDMPFPNGFMEKLLAANVTDFARARQYFSQEYMTWEIFSILNEGKVEAFPELAEYLSGHNAVLHQWQLAERVAALFDRYQIYRYEQRDFPLNDDCWQTRIWKELRRRYGRSKIECIQDFFNIRGKISGLPGRVTIFGAGSMPPLYLNVFCHAAKDTEVHFFYLNPCKDYWGELRSKYEMRREEADFFEYEVANPLLASWGTSGRELFSNLLTRQGGLLCEDTEDSVFETYIDSEKSPAILQQLQEDICNMFDRRNEEYKLSAAGDDSIEILNCHAPRREVEILHDKLLKLIHSGKVEMRNIIVMAPDINDYYPYIDAVFSRGQLKNCYTVSDRNLHTGCGVGDIFVSLLKISSARLTVPEVMQLLSTSVIGATFNISGQDLLILNRYLSDSRVCWGSDGKDHERFCGVDFDEFSWQNAMDRIFTLFAAGRQDVEREIEGLPLLREGDMELFGRFCYFIRMIKELRETLRENRTLGAWMELLQRMLNTFFSGAGSGEKADIAELRKFITGKGELAEKLRIKGVFPVQVIIEIVGKFLNSVRDTFSFLRGKITFCSLTPLRSVPADVIAVLGLDDNAFPRRDFSLGFDLMNRKILPGDHSPAREDRYLFLEALMSARKYFWCFYNGRSRRNGKVQMPSAVLAELADYLKQSCRDFEEVKHHLQPFAPEYFKPGGALFSYSEEDLEIARILKSPPEEIVSGRIVGYIAAPGDPIREFALEDLIRWAKDPANYLFFNLLNIRCIVPEAGREREGFAVSARDGKYLLKKNIAVLDNLNVSGDVVYAALRRNNMLPPGEAGKSALSGELELIRKLPESFRRDYFSQERMALKFSCSGIDVSGIFECSAAMDKQKLLFFSACKHKYHAEALIRHHSLCMVSDAEMVETVMMTLNNGKWDEFKLRSPGRGGESRSFWEKFLSLRQAGENRIPALFPKTLFELQRAFSGGRANVDRIKGVTFLQELDENAALRSCFTPSALDDPEIQTELTEFGKLFYNVDIGGAFKNE